MSITNLNKTQYDQKVKLINFLMMTCQHLVTSFGTLQTWKWKSSHHFTARKLGDKTIEESKVGLW